MFLLRNVYLDQESGEKHREQDPLGSLRQSVIAGVLVWLVVAVHLDRKQAENHGHYDLSGCSRAKENKHARKHKSTVAFEDLEPG